MASDTGWRLTQDLGQALGGSEQNISIRASQTESKSVSRVSVVAMDAFSHTQSMAAVMPDRVQPRCGDLNGIPRGVARANEFLKKFPRQHVPRKASVLSGPEAKA